MKNLDPRADFRHFYWRVQVVSRAAAASQSLFNCNGPKLKEEKKQLISKKNFFFPFMNKCNCTSSSVMCRQLMEDQGSLCVCSVSSHPHVL